MALNPKIKSFWEETPFKFCVYASIGLSVIITASILLLRNFLPPELPLYYGKPVGEGQLTSVNGLLVIPGVILVITIVNMVIGTLFKDVFIKRVLIFSALFSAVLLAITFTKIILLIGFF